MAIAFDAAAGVTTAVAASSVSHSHTCSGSDRILFAVGFANATGGNLTATYNGVAMSAIQTVSNGIKITLFYLVAPASGANTLQINWDGSATVLRVASASYTGAAQSGQPDSSTTGTDAASPFRISTTTVADNCWTIAAFGDNSGTVMTVEAGTTNRAGSGVSTLVLGDSNAAQTPAGSVTLGVTGAGSGGLQIIASFKPLTSTTTTLNLSESPTITERFSRTWTARRSLSDKPTLTERFSRSWSLIRGLSERITITESRLTGRIITAVLSELISISESFSRVVSWNRAMSESLGITENFSRAVAFTRELVESVGITDLLTRAVSYGRILVEAISITEYLRTPLNWLKRTVPSTTWTKRTPPSPSSSWTARTPPTSTWTKRTKP